MEWIKKNWIMLAILIMAGLAIYFALKPSPDRMLRKEMERQRDEARADFNKAQKIIERLQQDTAKLNKKFREYLHNDSIQHKQEEARYDKLQDAFNKIYFGDLSDPEIDSTWNAILERAGYKKRNNN